MKTHNHTMLRTRTKSQRKLRQIAKRQRWTLVEAFDIAVEKLEEATKPTESDESRRRERQTA